MTDLEMEIRRQRLSDELHAIYRTNIGQLDGETYEQNLERRARLEMRTFTKTD